MVTLFETLLDNTEKYKSIQGIAQDEAREKCVAARSLLFKVCVCFMRVCVCMRYMYIFMYVYMHVYIHM